MTKKDDHLIIAIHITDRLSKVSEVQTVLTEFGNVIKTRLGLHSVSDRYDGPEGIIILELLDNKSEKERLINSLEKIEGVEVKEILFQH